MRNNQLNHEGTKTQRNIFSLMVTIFLVTALVSWALPVQAKVVDEIAVVVDQESMTRGELEASIADLFRAQKLNPPEPGTADYEKAKNMVIEGFIREVLLAEEADRQKVEISDGEVDHEVNNQIESMKKGAPSEQEFNDALKQEGLSEDDLKQDFHDKILRRMKAQRALHMKQQELPTAATVTEEEVKAYYKAHPKDFEQVKFSIILFRVGPKSKPELVKQVETQARGILKELQTGADFAAYAKKYSEDPGSSERGGAVGTVFRSDLEPKLAKGVFSIPEKGLGLVRGADGFYIVRVDYKSGVDFASVAPSIKEQLRGERQDSGLKDWLNGLKKEAYILVDGKPVAGNFVEATGGEETKLSTNPATPAGEETTPGEAQGNTTVAGTAETAGADMGTVYPSLPPGDSFTFYFTGHGFFYNTQDLGNYYPDTNVSQTFPFGYGLSLGADWVLEPSIHVGVMGEVLRKWLETVGSDQWNVTAGGQGLDAKLVLPLDESTNFVVSAMGGLYFLFWSTANLSGTTYTLTGNTWGGRGSVALEFLLDEQKNSALDLGGGYRLLNFNATGTPLASTLDFSGPFAELGFKFYFGKD